MKILALDLGTNTGWALSPGSLRYVPAGTWTLETRDSHKEAKKLRLDRRLDPRVANLVDHLYEFHMHEGLDWIVFEDVKFIRSQAQAHLWASFRGAVWAFAYLNDIRTDCLDTGKLKKLCAGHGFADKPAMMRALVRRYPALYELEKDLVKCRHSGTLLDDNAVDALHLLTWATSIIK